MYAYKTQLGWIIETEQGCYQLPEKVWDSWMNATQIVPDALAIASLYEPIHTG